MYRPRPRSLAGEGGYWDKKPALPLPMQSTILTLITTSIGREIPRQSHSTHRVPLQAANRLIRNKNLPPKCHE
jgi:hypothetical protein